MSQKLSLCMIAKDEDFFLKDCLDSVKGLVDEIILVDTGSTDNTIQIAKDFGAKVIHQEWDDDFSKPRNLSLKNATGDWILFLDPDECLSLKDHVAIKQAMEKKNVAFLIETKNYVFSKDPYKSFKNSEDTSDTYSDMSRDMPFYWISEKARLFPNNPKIEFTGAVHEMVEPSINELTIKLEKLSVPVHHYAQLDPKRSRKKRFFYVNITRKKVLREPKNAKAYLELAREYLNIRLYYRAIQTLRKGMNLTKDSELLSTMHYEMSSSYFKLKQPLQAQASMIKSLEYNSINLNCAVELERHCAATNNDNLVFASSAVDTALFSLKRYSKIIERHPDIETKFVDFNTFEIYYFMIKSYEALKNNLAAEILKSKIKEYISSVQIPILCYHDIGDVNSAWCVSKSSFEKQLSFLKKLEFKFLTIDKLDFKKLNNNKNKQIAITFDDGRESVHSVVLPILNKLDIKANFFITINWIDGENIPPSETYSNFLSWSNIQTLIAENHFIGSHSFSHKNLTSLSNEDIKFELSESKKILESKLKTDVSSFVYPYGGFNQEIADLTKNAGYSSALTTEFKSCKESGFAMPRIIISRYLSFEAFEFLFKEFLIQDYF